MLTKLLFIFSLVLLLFTYGQSELKFFRKDYTYLKETSNFYKIHTLHKNWEEAKDKCEQEGATLFYPDDEDEALVILTHWNSTQEFIQRVYIGVADWNVREVFETVDGRPIADVYDNWASGEPNNADSREGCVIMRRDGTLNDVNCEDKYQFICKKTLATVQWNSLCNLPDERYEFTVGRDNCYKFHLTPKNWNDAHATCHSEQSYLAIINSESERNHLVNITANAPKDDIVGDYLRGGVHLGFKKKNGWVTVKGVPLHESGYSKWAYRQPDGGDLENCGSMFYNGELNDIGCSQKMFFICEHEVPIRAEDIIYKFNDENQSTISPGTLQNVFGKPY